jgi:hypothetical protein
MAERPERADRGAKSSGEDRQVVTGLVIMSVLCLVISANLVGDPIGVLTA